MTLQQFLSSTEGTPRDDLRQALAEALVEEPPRSPLGYSRLYDRVLTRLRWDYAHRRQEIASVGGVGRTSRYRIGFGTEPAGSSPRNTASSNRAPFMMPSSA